MVEAGGGNLKNLTCGGKIPKEEAEVTGIVTLNISVSIIIL